MNSDFEKLNFISSTPMVKLKNKNQQDINQHISVSLLRELHKREKKLKKYIEKFQKNMKAYEKTRKSFIENFMPFSDKNESSFSSSSTSYCEYSSIEKPRKTTFSEIEYTNSGSGSFLRSFSKNSSTKSDYQKVFESLSLKKQPENSNGSVALTIITDLNESNKELHSDNQLVASERNKIDDVESDESILDFENEEKLNLQLEKAANRHELINHSRKIELGNETIIIENLGTKIRSMEYTPIAFKDLDELSSYKSLDKYENRKFIDKPNKIVNVCETGDFINQLDNRYSNKSATSSNFIGESDNQFIIESLAKKSTFIGGSDNNLNLDESDTTEMSSVDDIADYSIRTIDKVKEWLENSNSNVLSENLSSTVEVKSNIGMDLTTNNTRCNLIDNEPSSIYIKSTNCNPVDDENNEFVSNIHVNFKDNIEIFNKSSSVEYNQFETNSEDTQNKRVISDFNDELCISVNDEDEGMYSDERKGSWKSINEDIIACVNKSTIKKNELLNKYNLSKSRIILDSDENQDEFTLVNESNQQNDSPRVNRSPNILTSTRLDDSSLLIPELVKENEELNELLNSKSRTITNVQNRSEISLNLSPIHENEQIINKSFLLSDKPSIDISELLNENQMLREFINQKYQNTNEISRNSPSQLNDKPSIDTTKLLNENQRLQKIINANSQFDKPPVESEIKALKNLVRELYELYDSMIESEKQEIVRLRNVIVEQSIININKYNMNRHLGLRVSPRRNMEMVH